MNYEGKIEKLKKMEYDLVLICVDLFKSSLATLNRGLKRAKLEVSAENAFFEEAAASSNFFSYLKGKAFEGL